MTSSSNQLCERERHEPAAGATKGSCDDRLAHPLGPPAQPEDPERIAIREALAFGKAVYDQRNALGLSVDDLAGRTDITAGELECIEEGGTEPTIALLRRLAAPLDADVHQTPGHDLGSVWFEPHAA